MKNRYVLLKRKQRIDKHGKNYFDVIVVNTVTGFVDSETTKYNLSESTASKYKAFIDSDGLVGDERFSSFDEFCKAVDYYEGLNSELKTAVSAKDFFDDGYQKKINDAYERMVENDDWFHVNESSYSSSLISLRNRISEYSPDFMEIVRKNFLFSNVYGTTKMEEINLSEGVAKRIFSKKQGVSTQSELQFANNKNSFLFALENNERKHLDSNDLKTFHVLCTKGLDAMKNPLERELDYMPGELRNSPVNIQGKYCSPSFSKRGIISKIDEIIEKSYKLGGISGIAYFHLCFYLLHPFQNGNKRTTRVGEYVLFKEHFPEFFNSFVGMGYFFYYDSDRFFKLLANVMSTYYSESSVRLFASYYVHSFNEMILMSCREIEIRSMLLSNFEGSDETFKEVAEILFRNEVVYGRELANIVNKKIFDKTKALKRDSVKDYLLSNFGNWVRVIKDDGDDVIFESKVCIPLENFQ